MTESFVISPRQKLSYTLQRIKLFILSWPKRGTRIFWHLNYPLRLLVNNKKTKFIFPRYKFIFWFVGLAFLLLDIFGLTDLYDVVCLWIKKYARPLSDIELIEARKIFFDSPELDMVIIDPAARFGTRKHHIIYVSFYTINSWGAISNPVLIHELMHIWQYEKFGSAYIALALQAQFSKMRYDYGGVPALIKNQGVPFSVAFNFEQQADLIEDYYRSKQNLPLQWSLGGTITNYWLAVWARNRLSE